MLLPLSWIKRTVSALNSLVKLRLLLWLIGHLRGEVSPYLGVHQTGGRSLQRIVGLGRNEPPLVRSPNHDSLYRALPSPSRQRPLKEIALQVLLGIVLEAGKAAIELTLYVLLPVLVVTMAIMRVLEAKGVLGLTARILSPVLRPFGIPGVGVFAMLQMLFVSFAAPRTTLDLMERQGIPQRSTAATLAMILAMSQANAVFPLLTVGLSLPLVLSTSLIGGLTAAAVTYHLLVPANDELLETKIFSEAGEPSNQALLTLLIRGGEQGMQLCLQAFPSLLLALFALKAVAAVGAVSLLEGALSPIFNFMGLPGISVLPLATKYLAGGTAMLGVVTDLIHSGSLGASDLNRLSGILINPLDLVGLSILCPAGTRTAAIVRPAVFGAATGILIRGILHLTLA